MVHTGTKINFPKKKKKKMTPEGVNVKVDSIYCATSILKIPKKIQRKFFDYHTTHRVVF
jgi:hypothetical protein